MVLLTDGWSQWAAAAAAADPLIAVAPPAIAPTRLAHIASSLFPESIGTPSQAIRAAKRGRILIDDNTASHAALVHEGSILTLLPASSSVVAAADDETVRFAASCVRAGLRVLYEDDGFAVVYKPAGVHTKPWGGMRAARTLEAALPAVLAAPAGRADVLCAPTAVHRLDCRVAGCLVVAKASGAAAFLSEEFRERRVAKLYRGLCVGRPGDLAEGEAMDVTSPIDGRAASTRLRVRRSVPHVQAGALTLVDLEPRTGRRHQLRRHCLALGAPLLGDDLYATPAATAAVKSRAGLFLQSVEVKLRHPDSSCGSERWVEVKADEAPKFQRVVERSLHGFEFARKEVGSI